MVTLAEIQDSSARKVARSHSTCILSFDLIGQHQNKREYVTENRFAARVRRSYFSEQRPEMRLLFAGYHLTATPVQQFEMNKGQRTVSLFLITCFCHITAGREVVISVARDRLRNNMPCICGIICERKMTICRSLFRSERSFLMQHKRGEILAWKVYLQFILGLILDKPVLTACMRESSLYQVPRLGSKQRLSAAVCIKFLYKIKMRFSEVFLKCPLSASIE